MLIQVEYGNGEFFVRNQTVYYQEIQISPVNPAPLWAVGEYELYMFPTVPPMKGAWLVVVQSRYPAFYECREVVFEKDQLLLYLIDGRKFRVKSFRDGVCDRLLVDLLLVDRRYSI